MTPEPTVQDETTHKSDDSAADGVQGDHADQQECEHHQGAPPPGRRERLRTRPMPPTSRALTPPWDSQVRRQVSVSFMVSKGGTPPLNVTQACGFDAP